MELLSDPFLLAVRTTDCMCSLVNVVYLLFTSKIGERRPERWGEGAMEEVLNDGVKQKWRRGGEKVF